MHIHADLSEFYQKYEVAKLQQALMLKPRHLQKRVRVRQEQNALQLPYYAETNNAISPAVFFALDI